MDDGMKKETKAHPYIHLINFTYCYIIWMFRRFLNARNLSEDNVKIRSSMAAGCVYGFILLIFLLWINYLIPIYWMKKIWIYECVILFVVAVISYLKYEKYAMKFYNHYCDQFDRINVASRVGIDVLISLSIMALPLILAISGKFISGNL